MDYIHLDFLTDSKGRKLLFPVLPETGLNQKLLHVVVNDGDIKKMYPVFQQKAGIYGEYSEYMKRHGCACCSLTTILAAFVEEYADLRPDETITKVEKKYFPKEVYTANYSKVMARQMPVSLYGISVILKNEGIACKYVGNFEDKVAEKQITEHLYKGNPVIIETSRMRRKGRRIVRFFDKKYAGSYHTMILLGIDENGQVIFTDSATRDWAGEKQRLKCADLSEVISYMFPQKNVEDTHLYFSRKKNTGGYILILRSKTDAAIEEYVDGLPEE